MKNFFLASCGAVALVAGTLVSHTASSADQVTVEPAPAAPAAAAFDWTGFYVGAQLGYAELDPNSAASNLIQPDSNGFIGGVHLGYDHQVNNWLVLGIEGDFLGTDLSETAPCFNPAFSCNAGADWMASIRARAGVAMDRWLVYATGGVAFLDYDGFTAIGGTTFSDSQTLTGWTVGGGFEYAWTDNVIFGVEGRYSDFEDHTMQYDIPYPVDPDVFSVVGRVRIKFDAFMGN